MLRACCMFLNCESGTCASSIAPELASASAPPASVIRPCPEGSSSPVSPSRADHWLIMLARPGASLARVSTETDMAEDTRWSLAPPAPALGTCIFTWFVPTVTDEARASADTSWPAVAVVAVPASSETLPLRASERAGGRHKDGHGRRTRRQAAEVTQTASDPACSRTCLLRPEPCPRLCSPSSGTPSPRAARPPCSPLASSSSA